MTTFTATATLEFDITDETENSIPATAQVEEALANLFTDHRQVFHWEVTEDGEGCWEVKVSAWLKEQQDWAQLEDVTQRHLGADWLVGFGEATEDED